MKEETERTSDLALERYALGELPPDRRRELEEALSADPELAARLKAIEDSNREILERYPADRMAALVEARLEAERGSVEAAPDRSRFRNSLALSLGAAAVLLVGLFALMPERILSPLLGGPAQELTRIKGAPAGLVVLRKTSGGSERLADRALAAKGDLLQLGYMSSQAGYGAIFSIDGRGLLTFHLPSGGDPSLGQLPAPGAALPLETGRIVTLPSAYELDDAPSFERFFFVRSPRPFSLGPLLEAAQKLARSGNAREGSLDLPSPLGWSSFLLQKEEVP